MIPAGLNNLLEWIAQEIEPDIQLGTLRAFLFVAERGTCQQKDVELHLKSTNASTSRNISYWTDRRFDRKPGKNFIKREEDDYDRRMRNLTLTKKGQAFYDQLKERL